MDASVIAAVLTSVIASPNALSNALSNAASNNPREPQDEALEEGIEDLTDPDNGSLVNLAAIGDRQTVERAIELLYHHTQTLALGHPGGVGGDSAAELRTLAARLRATLDRTPEMWSFIQDEGQQAAPFVYADGERER